MANWRYKEKDDLTYIFNENKIKSLEKPTKYEKNLPEKKF